MRRPVYSLAVALICYLFGIQINAQTTWNNAGGDFDWFNAANWSAGLPVNGNDAVINAPDSVAINLSSSLTFDFKITSTSIIFIDLGNFSLDYNEVLTNNGTLLINGNNGVFTNLDSIYNDGAIQTGLVVRFS